MKLRAVIEVTVVFGITLFLIVLAARSPLGQWEKGVTNRWFVEYAVMIAVPLLVLVASRRNLASNGVSLRNLRYQLEIAATALVPVAIASVPLSFVDDKAWSGALILAAVEVALLISLGLLLRKKPTRNESGMVIGSFVLLPLAALSQKATLGNGFSAFIFYVFFVGLGEELLFRGYVQSTLNAVFGRPFKTWGVCWGWGIVITSLLFGLMHCINTGSIVTGAWQPAPWWGFWTFFAGLALGFVREKTGSIVAPTILHGLPQALASAFMGV